MSEYAGLSIKEIYTRKCEEFGCKKNSQLMKTLPQIVNQFDTLEELDLGINFVGPRGLLPVLEVVKASTALKILTLRDNQLTNQSVQDVVDFVITHRSLTKLDVSNNPITLGAGKALLELAQANPRVKYIAIDNTSIRPMLVRSVQNQCAKNIQMMEKSAMATWNPLSADQQQQDKAVAHDGVLDWGTTRNLLGSLPHSIHPVLFDSNPTESFLMLCEQHEARFNDPQFPPEIPSIGDSPTNERYKVATWRPISSIISNPVLFNKSGTVEVQNVKLGAANTSWMVASLAEIIHRSSDDNPFVHLFSPQQIHSYGIYTVKFFVNGKWRYIVIDDHIPCTKDGAPAFTHPTTGEECWLMLLEKAIAKLHGSYQAIDSCAPLQSGDRRPNCAALMMDLTAGVGTTRDFGHSEFEPNALWDMLSETIAKGALVTTYCNDKDAPEKEKLGLAPNHTYCMRAAKAINGFRLVLLRSGWVPETAVWEGEWSDSSPLWAQYPDVGYALQFSSKDDQASFWMPYSVYLKLFATVHLCRVFSNQNTVLVEGQWDKKTAGGPLFDNTWCFNPHYKLRIDHSGPFFIHMSLPDTRFLHCEVDTISFHMLKSDYYPLKYELDNVAAKTDYVITDNVFYEGYVEQGQYWLVPSTYQEGKMSPYFLRLFSTSSFTILQEPIDPYWKEITVMSKWYSSGEYQSGEDNPQFSLHLPTATNTAGEAVVNTHHLVITLTVDDGPEYSVVFFICSDDGDGRLLGTIPDDQVVVKSKYLISNTVRLQTSLPSGGKYTVVACLQPEKSVSRCSMSFWCTCTDFSVVEMPLWKKKEIKTEWQCAGQYQTADGHPQVELVVAIPMKIIIKMSVDMCNDPTILFFLVDNSDNVGCAMKGVVPNHKILTKSSFVQGDSVLKQYTITKPLSSYLIVPNLQPPGSRGRCTISVSASCDDFQLHQVF
eukprot:TRINITY_DN63362_c0_g1_i1.p1 TRINITY_DN63362_c0_g1~~TRINITY_DN63362_c0_g1_i1.p1  ORF type:complete len:938 (+),score=61.09 TRINITY_DN63362_c0_g1_i1:28-2841(+)